MRLRRAIPVLLWCAAGIIACRTGGDEALIAVEVTTEPAGAQLLWFPPEASEWYGTGAPVDVGTTPTTWTPPGNAASLDNAGRLVAWVPEHGRAEVALSADALSAAIDIPIPRFGSVRIGSDPIGDFTLTGPSGRVRVADERTPYVAQELEPGEYTISVERPGWAAYEATVRVMAATESEHVVRLEQDSAGPDGEARVDVGWATFEGAVDPGAFYDAFMPRSRELDGCYERALANDPGAGGTIVLRLHVNDAFGTVDRVEVVSSAVEHDEATDCFTRRVGRVEVGAGAPGTSIVELPLYALRVPR